MAARRLRSAAPAPSPLPEVLESLSTLPPEKIDPYLVWALVTGFRGFSMAVPARLPFAVELSAPGAASALARRQAPGGGPLVQMGASYRVDPRSSYCTLSVAVGDLAAFLAAPEVVRADMGAPGVEHGLHTQAVQPLDLAVGDEGAYGWTTTTPVVGLIDHGVAVLNRKFSLGGGAGAPPFRRVVRLWDQWAGFGSAAPARTGWTTERAFGYGAVLDRTPANGDYPGVPVGQGEALTYRRWGYRPVQGAAAHGTHVLDVAAGVPDPLRPRAAPGQVPALPIVAVQLPWLPRKDVSGASLCVQVLDALRFICESAGPGRPVVVNISDGAMAGSHNGGSVLEEAIDEYIEQRPGLSVVVAAGNAYDKRTHASGQIEPGGSVSLAWQVLPDDSTESFLEIWADTRDDFTVALTPPGASAPVFTVARNWFAHWAPATAAGGPGPTRAAAIHLAAAANGRGQHCLLALRPSRRPADDAVPHGEWTVTLKNTSANRRMQFDAWVERDDPPFGDYSPRRQSQLRRLTCTQATAEVDGRNTFNSIATGEATIVVGAYRRSTGQLSAYTSAAGDSDVGKRPTVVAPGDDSVCLPGLLAAGNLSGSVQRMNGTSVAAPVVTRMIAEALDRRTGAGLPNHLAIKAAVRRAAIHRQPPPEPGQPEDPEVTTARSGSGWVTPGARLPLP